MGIDPFTGAPTNALLGPFLTNYSSFDATVVNSMSGSTLIWSAMYVRSVKDWEHTHI